MKKIYLLFLLGMVNFLSAQENNSNIPKIFPPSPNAYQLGNYGNIEIGEFTGSFQNKIDLLSYSIGNIKLPISLNYSSSGIKVDDYNSTVGLGWGLDAGGVVSVITRGLNDSYFDFTVLADNAPTSFKNRFIQDAAGEDVINTERDLYRLNISGIYSTQFVINDNKILEAKQSDYLINLANKSFTVKDLNGTKYTFDLVESTTTRSIGAGWSMRNYNGNSAFYLTKIEDKNGYIVSISYESEFLEYTTDQSQSYEFLLNSYNVPNGCSSKSVKGLSPMMQTRMQTSTYRIKQITNNKDNSVISFEYANLFFDTENRTNYLKRIKYQIGDYLIEDINLDYLITANHRVFLKDLNYLDKTKKYSFTYDNPNLLPKRLTLAQDYWGYYNDGNGTTLVPSVENFEYLNYPKSNRQLSEIKSKIGLITEIKYPTKGTSKIEYENNSYYGKQTTLPIKEVDYLNVYSGISGIGNKNLTFSSPVDQKVEIYLEVKFDDNSVECRDADDTNRQRMNVRLLSQNGTPIGINNSTNPISIPFYSITITKNLNGTYYANLQKGQNYILEVSGLSPSCSRGFAYIKYYKQNPIENFTNILTGGNRVKSIQNISDNHTNTVRYHYAKTSDLTKSSGELGYNPYFIKKSTKLSYCSSPSTSGPTLPGMYTPYETYSIGSSSLIPLAGNEGSHIQYKFVSKSFGGDNFENGGEQKEFIINRDAVAAHYAGTDSNEAQYSNTGWDNGIEKQNLIFNKNLKTLKDTRFEYFYNENKKIEVNNIISRENSKPDGPVGMHLHQCTADDINNSSYGYKLCTKIGDDFPYHTQDNMSIFYNAYQYKSISHNYNLSKTTTTEYFENNEPIVTEINYIHDSENHTQLTKQTTKNSKGEVLTTEYKYPPDLTTGYVESTKMNRLVNENRIAEPIIVKQKVGNTYVSEVHNQYNEFYGILQKSAVFQKKGNGIELNRTTDRKIVYNSYDAKGNITQYTVENGLPVAIIWGYNTQYPIAKIEGTNYSAVEQFVTDLQNLSNNGSLTKDSFSGLRTALPNAMITTYVYKPLVGVTQITGPNGISENYTYDSANRLEEIKNDKNEVLKTFQYNYKP
ncbi:hypothetical protein SAMN05443634_102302 [Chishuiella changwenlii]|uniref:YD repeat-containing protein n=1 Tax=Chishuiella changwenlii TaxID=1434701 RepID=A0A1M6UC98_9FLAO|nr:hypothetical protein [Chishuiella changwenlii]GGE99238.1 hypothetical protein GCM10010984_16020 [Chishuiella changwenlii]SHK66678.1 hypothetical protein SAMN05443634_102302 [Chishuiella changwenlii]